MAGLGVSVFKYRSVFTTLFTAARSSPPSFLPPLSVCAFSSRWTASGGHGSTTSVSRSWSRLTRRAGDSRASQPWTTWPRLPAGLCSEPTSKVLTRQTHASNGATKPKTFQDADRCEREREKERGRMNRTSTDHYSKNTKVGFTVFVPIIFELQSY